MGKAISRGRNSISNCELPSGNQKSAKFEVTFVDTPKAEINLQDLFLNKELEFVQTLYFFNRNSFGITISVSDTGQTLYIAALKAGYIPILVGEVGLISLVADATGDLVTDMHFINVPIYPVLFDAAVLI